MTPPTVLLRVTPEAIETLFTRDHDGNRLRVEWGEAGADGFHDPVISVDYTDNIHAADKATIATLRAQYAAQLNRTIEANSTIAALRAALELAHDHHSFGPRDCTSANCSAEAVLATFRPHPDRRTEW